MSDSALKQLVIQPVPDCDPLIGSWLGAIQDSRDRTMRCLEGLSPTAVDWSAAYTPHTIGTLLYHIAAIEIDWLFGDVLDRNFPPQFETLFPYDVRDQNGMLTIVKGRTLDDYWGRLNIVRQMLLDNYQRMSLDDFRHPRIQPDYQVTPEWVLHHLCQHEAEHRSELALLRSQFEAKEEVSQ